MQNAVWVSVPGVVLRLRLCAICCGGLVLTLLREDPWIYLTLSSYEYKRGKECKRDVRGNATTGIRTITGTSLEKLNEEEVQ